MAAFALTTPTTEAIQPARQSYLIPTDAIDLVDRLRELDWDWCQALAADFATKGQQQPATVVAVGNRYRLVIGGHRWGACQIAGRPLEAFIVDQDWAEARSAEIVENLMRRDLSKLDRAAFIAELYEVERVRAGLQEDEAARKLGAAKRWARDASANLALASGLADSVAAKVGLSKRAIFLDLSLHKALLPDLARAIGARALDVPAAKLRAAGRLGPVTQRQLAAAIAGGQGFDQALKAALPPRVEASPEDKRLSTFISTFSRMGAREKRAALATLAGMDLPKGVRIDLGGDADA